MVGKYRVQKKTVRSMKKMSKDFNKIKDWFIHGFWSEKRVRDAVKMGKITQEECDIILSIKG